MQRAKVIGNATSSVKHSTMEGVKMLIVQPLNGVGGADGDPLIAIDGVGAGPSDQVFITSDGRYGRQLMKSDYSPIRWSIIGIEDE